jgi:non-canonical (house-cleaning) NTP pyrophosphatase
MAEDYGSNDQQPRGEEEIRKDAIMRAAETLLRQVDPDASLEWVRAGSGDVGLASSRRIMQLRG